ncbi:hypothetical protein [Pseudarthrobacter sp. DSP2-3-2b1]|uniref:hypothetical protein n=1 Tax=Pseudarthrobacter sp. DSP2-3-2b1 TaxID=2804661 RepID=UPI003CF88EB3
MKHTKKIVLVTIAAVVMAALIVINLQSSEDTGPRRRPGMAMAVDVVPGTGSPVVQTAGRSHHHAA